MRYCTTATARNFPIHQLCQTLGQMKNSCLCCWWHPISPTNTFCLLCKEELVLWDLVCQYRAQCSCEYHIDEVRCDRSRIQSRGSLFYYTTQHCSYLHNNTYPIPNNRYVCMHSTMYPSTDYFMISWNCMFYYRILLFCRLLCWNIVECKNDTKKF